MSKTQELPVANSFEVLPEDICTVLNLNWPRVTNPGQVSAQELALALYDELDVAGIGAAALERGGFRLNRQLQAAYQEIQAELTTRGLLQ